MTQTLILYTHPSKKGHNGAILKEVQKYLIKQKEDFLVIDLYNDNFNPILKLENINSPNKKVRFYQDQIKKSNKLIFIYPVWWGSFPALLKGFFDQVFTKGFAFNYVPLPFSFFGMRARPKGLLQDKKALVFLTMGARKWQNIFFLHNRSKKTIQKHFLGFCGIKSKVFSLYSATKLTPEKRLEIKHLVAKALK